MISSTIQSVYSQENNDYEIIVVDDGSTDDTSNVIAGIGGDRLKYFKTDNRERGAARNFGIEQSVGEYVTFLDSDDKLYENHLTEAYDLINQNNRPEWFHLAYEIKTPEGKTLRRISHEGEPRMNLLRGNDLSCLGVFVRSDVIKRNLFNEVRKLSGSEDWELWMRLACQYPLSYSNMVTSCLVHHPQRGESNQENSRLIERIELVKRLVINNPCFQEKYARYGGLVSSHLYLFIALHSAISKISGQCFRYLGKAIVVNPIILFSRKMVIIFAKLIFGHNGK